MGLIELFLIAVGLSMDAFAVSVCKGLAMPKCTFKKAAIVGLWFGGFQALPAFVIRVNLALCKFSMVKAPQ